MKAETQPLELGGIRGAVCITIASRANFVGKLADNTHGRHFLRKVYFGHIHDMQAAVGILVSRLNPGEPIIVIFSDNEIELLGKREGAYLSREGF